MRFAPDGKLYVVFFSITNISFRSRKDDGVRRGEAGSDCAHAEVNIEQRRTLRQSEEIMSAIAPRLDTDGDRCIS